MSTQVKDFHEYIIRAALKVNDLYEVIANMDLPQLKYMVQKDVRLKDALYKRYKGNVPKDISMMYLYRRLDQELSKKKNGVITIW